MIWDSLKIAEQIGASHPHQPALAVRHILFDSRKYNAAKDPIFFALSGVNHDGHDYIPELYQKGLRLFVVERQVEGDFPEALFLQVEDSLGALQSLARGIREKINPQLVALTGSNGKTIVKEWLYRLVAQDFKSYRSPKSYNSQIGVPLSVWAMPEDTQLGIFEAGISLPGEMHKLAQVLQPDVGIFTNIGSAHGENFESRKQKIWEKLALFRHAKYLVFPADDQELAEELRTFSMETGLELYDWSYQRDKALAWVKVLEQRRDFCRFQFHYGEHEFECELPFGEEASLQNAINAIYPALLLGVLPMNISQRVKRLSPIEMRLEMKEGQQDTLLINDAYNSDLESLRVALHFMREHGKDRSKVLILSDVLQSGLSPEALHQSLSDIIAREDLEALFAVGPQLQKYPLDLPFPVHYFENTEAFLTARSNFNWESKALLLKGARPFRFERIDQAFAQQRHETVLEIHLDRLVHNLNYYRARMPENVNLMVMVKAFAYGAGIEEIAKVLAFHGVDYLAVAYADEGVALRKAGIELPIMVLNPESAALDSFFEYNLEPEIYSFSRWQEFLAMAEKREQELRVHLKFETGMHRLGFVESELAALLEGLNGQPYLKVASAFSHLAASDDPREHEFTRNQIALFERMSAKAEASLGYSFLKHIANTGAIEAYPEAYFDMVRLGIGLYGIAAHPKEQKQLSPVAELKATISQIKSVAKGETVGYGRSWRAEEDVRIAIVSIGYADGFSRALSNGVGQVLIKGKPYPVVGRVCMDMCMIKLGDASVEEGDEVLIFGKELPVANMAKALGTIPYEVLTSISPRVKRVYYLS